MWHQRLTQAAVCKYAYHGPDFSSLSLARLLKRVYKPVSPSSIPIENGNGSKPWMFLMHRRSELVNVPKSGERRSELMKRQLWIGWPAQQRLWPEKEKKQQGCYLKLWALPQCCYCSSFHWSLWIPLRFGADNNRRYVDLTGYLQSKSGLPSNMPLPAILNIFLYKHGRPTCRSGLPAVLFPVTFFNFFVPIKRWVKKKSHQAGCSSQPLFRFRLYKKTLVCSYKMIPMKK